MSVPQTLHSPPPKAGSFFILPKISCRSLAAFDARSLAMLRLLALLVAAAPLIGPAFADQRVALVVGNGSYAYVPKLDNPVNDARLMVETLKGLGFSLVGGTAQIDLDKPQFDNA